MADRLSQLDADQVIKRAGIALSGGALPNVGLAVTNVGGSLVPESYDTLNLTYVASGNGAGEVETVEYVRDSETIANLTLTYDAQNRVISVVRS